MSLSFVLVPAASWFVFGETLGHANILGAGFYNDWRGVRDPVTQTISILLQATNENTR